MENIVALKTRVIGKLLGESAQSSILWTPTKKEGVRQLMLVTHVGPDVREVEIGDTVILPDKWTGAELKITDDEDPDFVEELFVVEEKYLLATIKGSNEII